MEPLDQMDALTCRGECTRFDQRKADEIKKREEQIQKDSTEINTQIYANLHLNIKKLSPIFQPDHHLRFNLDCSSDRQMLKQLSRFVVSPKSKISFLYSLHTNSHLKEFFSKSIPPKIKEINASSIKFDKSPSYFNLVLRAIMHTTASVKVNSFRNLNMKQLKRLFSANKHTKSLAMFNCSLRLPACPDFSDCFRGTTLSELRLYYVKMTNCDESDTNLHKLDRLISGLSKSPDLHRSIKRIEIFAIKTTKEQNDQALLKYGFPYK
ncbi:unnamed protein product [Moneuplotes crassus]|uniref:Uncharacterized protein n=1 Tax=Euplotes crassus TaxID=5936 RepID=A0AAD1Y7B3_EUPCR|nr:unnamed protein product [Moneuplotes crassus]